MTSASKPQPSAPQPAPSGSSPRGNRCCELKANCTGTPCGDTNCHLPEASEHTKGDTAAANLTLQAEVKGLRELVDLYKERLTDAD